MSSALAIAGTSAVLQSLLNGILNHAGLGSVNVTAVAPDIVQTSQSSHQSLQVNLFLHQVTPNAAWRNMGMPSLAADGKTRLHNQPIALDLHYLLTAYGTQNFEAEALLGFAVQFLYQTPVLVRGDIQAALNPAPTTGNTVLNDALDLSGLADQVETLKVTPATLGREEVAWLWTALKADYRPTFPFQVTVVLIQVQNPGTAPLPVATRNIAVQPGLLSSVLSVAPVSGQPAAFLGDTIAVSGTLLSNAVSVSLSNSHLGIQYPGPTDPPLVPTQVTATSLQFILPNSPAVLPSGVYLASVQVQPPGSPTRVSSNSLPLAIASKISGLPASIAGPSFTLTPTCSPPVLARQQVSLVLGGQAFPANSFTTASTTSPVFACSNVAAGTYLVRLRVDGIDSPISFKPLPAAPSITVT